MGKATRFIKSLLGFRTTEAAATQPARSDSEPKQPKRRWSFAKSHTEIPRRLRNPSISLDETSLNHYHRNLTDNEDPNKHAIALAAATAAVVDAAVAAAQAAAEVVRITSRTTGYGAREDLSAVKIQSCFRAYLARRALKALKALVKLQAVVRGHQLRKQTADMMRRLQALLRAQARARALRSHFSNSTTKPSSTNFHHHESPTPEKIEQFPHSKYDNRSTSKRNNSKSYARDITMNHENDKIVEIDTGEPFITTKGKKLFQPDQINIMSSQSLTTSRGSTVQPTSSSPCASCEINSFEGSRSYVSGYSDHPNYMANTESSRAKVRSLSAPRLRGQNEVSSVTKRDSSYKYGSGVQWVPTAHDGFAKKAYSGSGRLDRLGMPVYDMGESLMQDKINIWVSKTTDFLNEFTSPLVKNAQDKNPQMGNSYDIDGMQLLFIPEHTIDSSRPMGDLSLVAIISIEQFSRLKMQDEWIDGEANADDSQNTCT